MPGSIECFFIADVTQLSHISLWNQIDNEDDAYITNSTVFPTQSAASNEQAADSDPLLRNRDSMPLEQGDSAVHKSNLITSAFDGQTHRHVRVVNGPSQPDIITAPSYTEGTDVDYLRDYWYCPIRHSASILSVLDDPDFLASSPSCALPHQAPQAALPPFSTSADPFHEDWPHWQLENPAT